MRISDWSSDVCSSDLHSRRVVVRGGGGAFWPLRQRLRRCHLPMASPQGGLFRRRWRLTKSPARLRSRRRCRGRSRTGRSEEHTSELQSLMRISYAVFCLKKKKKKNKK